MKASILSGIMSTAWKFYRTTGQSFSDCLKRSWANYKLVKALKSGIVKFYFQKVNGEIREAWGSLSEKVIPASPELTTANRKHNETVQTYYDTEVQDWRCFKKLNLIF